MNYLGADDDGRVVEAHGANLRRIEEIRRAYDPDGVFSPQESATPVG